VCVGVGMCVPLIRLESASGKELVVAIWCVCVYVSVSVCVCACAGETCGKFWAQNHVTLCVLAYLDDSGVGPQP
jgi:hypothetical protein